MKRGEGYCFEFIEKKRRNAAAFDDVCKCEGIKREIVHGDPKVANVLFCAEKRRAVALIDLDTVGPGLRLHDIGDMLRSVSCSKGEDGDLEKVSCDLYGGEVGP